MNNLKNILLKILNNKCITFKNIDNVSIIFIILEQIRIFWINEI